MRSLAILFVFLNLSLQSFAQDIKSNKAVDKNALLKQARYHSAKAEFSKSIEIYNSLLKLDPQSEDIAKLYDLRGFCRLKNKEYDKAIADFSAAIGREPKNDRYVFNRGMACHDDGQFAKAITDYDRAMELNDKNVAVYAERGLLYNLIGEYEKAEADLLAGYKIDPKSFYTVYGLTMLRSSCPNEKFRNGREALEYARQLMKLEKKNLNGSPAIAAAYAELGLFDKAIEWQQKAIERAAKNDKVKQEAAMELYQAQKPLRVQPSSVSK